MASVPEVIGSVSPREVIQQDTRACLPACLLAEIDPSLDLNESDITEVMINDGLYTSGEFGGTSLYPARTLNQTTEKLGLIITPVFDARLAGENEDSRIEERLLSIDSALRQGNHVILGFPKRREDNPPFLHYCNVTGYEITTEGTAVTIMDPSDVDGGIRHLSWEDFLEYLTPTEYVPVMAWGVNQIENGSNASCRSVQEQMLPGISLLYEPLANDIDTGLAIPPGTKHPSSVVMPTTEITKQFNNLGDIVLSRGGELPIGYPRFVVPSLVKELSLAAWGEDGRLPFPSFEAARAAAHLAVTYGGVDIETEVQEQNGLFWLPANSAYSPYSWQHTGLGISSRQAEASLEGEGENDLDRRVAAEATIKRTIERYTGARVNDIYLFPTGMSAIYYLNQALISMGGEASAVQFGFPYTDTFEQRKFGPHQSMTKNMVDLRNGDYEALAEMVASGQGIRHVMTECPSNPLLCTPDFEKLDAILDGGAPIIIDDTIGSFFNIDDQKLPSSVAARVTSLTKFFSSVGDVMGGSIILRRDSVYYSRLKQTLEAMYQDTLWHGDAEQLAKNSRHFSEVMPVINGNAESLVDWIQEEWTGPDKPIETIYHPTVTARKEFDAIRRSGAGYGGLMSLKFNDPVRGYRFFDRLQVTKGPSLGTFFTLGCLYTWLAHKPVESVSKYGVAPDLVRISTGIEDVDSLKARFEHAFSSSSEQ